MNAKNVDLYDNEERMFQGVSKILTKSTSFQTDNNEISGLSRLITCNTNFTIRYARVCSLFSDV